MKSTVDPWAGRRGRARCSRAKDFRSGTRDRWEGLGGVQSRVQGQPAFDGDGLVKDLPTSPKSHYRILDCGTEFPNRSAESRAVTAMMKTVKENKIKSDDKEIKVK
jgi:hypothetical protein